MNNPHYLKNTLWQKINGNIQKAEQALDQMEEDMKKQLWQHINDCQKLREQMFSWWDFWKRELQIIELETDAHHCSDGEKRRAILKEMATLIQINQELKKQLKTYEK